MGKYSITSFIGYARIIAILAIGGMLIAKRLTLLDATATLTFILGALGSAGHIAAKDQGSPEILSQVTVRESSGKDGLPIVSVAAKVDGERVEEK